MFFCFELYTSQVNPGSVTSCEMRNFVILLALGLISADKLDRTYLPPPGSKLAGGSPGAIQVPLELPKELYLGRDDGMSILGDPQLELGINRGLSELQATTEEAEPPFTYFQNSYRVPTTTTSYAFTQTTTLPPVLGSSIGLFKFGTTPGINIQAAAGPYRDEQFYNNNLPGFDNYGPEKPAFIISSVPQRNDIQTQIANNVLTQSQTPESLLGNENYQGPIGNFQGQTFIPFNQQPQIFDQQIVSQYHVRYPEPKTGEQRLNPTIVTPQVTTPSAQIRNELAGTHREMAPSYQGPDLSNSFPNRPALVKNISVLDSLSSAPQKSTNTNGQVLGSSQNTYHPTTTDAPITTSTSSYSEIPTSTSRFSSTIVPDISQSTLTPIRYKPRPERPQAESDRNAVILNYENALTPEGYSYSFDTSNGIHADETGTAVDGVKAHGSYSYIGDDGKVYSVVYTADENGFQPKGDHLPTPHPVPEAIQKVIEQAARDEAAGIYDDGSYDEAKYGYKKYQHPKIGLQTHKLQSVILNGADIPDDMQSVSRGTTEPQNTTGRPTNEGRPSKTNQVKNNEEIDNDRVPASIGKTYSTKKGPLTQMENIIRNPQNIVIPGGFGNKHFQAKQNNSIKNQPTIYQRRGDQNLFTKSFPAIEEETGYQYNPPENKFRPEVIQFPTRFTETVSDENETSSMKSTIKPFITPNIYNDDEEEENAYQPENNSSKYDDSHPEYYKKSTVSDLATSDDEGSIMTSKPGSTVVAIHREYGPQTLRPGSDTSAQDNFASTTPLSFSTTTTIQPDTTYQTYQPMQSYYDDGSDTQSSHRIGQPGITTPKVSVFSQNPEFVPGLTVAAFGRPITEQALDEQHSTGYPFKMIGPKSASFITFSDENGEETPGLHQGIFNPTVVRFGKPTSDEDTTSITFTDAYQSTENIIGEDFRGPKQPQRFDPKTGYHY